MDPLASLVDWIALYGVLGLLAFGLDERFVPFLPSYGVLVAIGIAANDDVWSVPVAVVGTAFGSFLGAFSLYLVVRALGEGRSALLLYSAGKWVGLSQQRIDRTLASLRSREGAITVASQLIPTIRLISPLAAGLLRTSAATFAGALAVGILLWNGLFIAAGSIAASAIPTINSSAVALKILVSLIVIEGLIALVFRLQLAVTKPPCGRKV